MAFAALDRKHTVAPAGYNRWLIPRPHWPSTCASARSTPPASTRTRLVEHFDTSLTSVGIVFSIAIVMLGLSAAVFGTWVDTGGPRRAMVAAALAWSVGFLVGAAGIATGQLWLLYLGYGVIGGIGLGIGYISPVSTLIKWFPDRPGLATGLAIMGFGGGALVASPVESKLLALYDSGFDPKDATSVASGSAVAAMFVTLGLAYLVVMLFGAWLIKVPADDWRPEGFDPKTVKAKSMVTTASVCANERRQDAAVLAAVGRAVLQRHRRHRHPRAGRADDPGLLPHRRRTRASTRPPPRASSGCCRSATWPAASCGPRPPTSSAASRSTWATSASAWCSTPCSRSPAHSSTALFVLFAGIIISFYGGGFATVPAYLRDLFGTFQVGAIHGRLLTAWSAAGVAGPLIINGFLDAEGTPGELTSDAYRPALLTMVGVLAVGFVANLLIRQVADRFHEPDRQEPQLTEQPQTGGGGRDRRPAPARPPRRGRCCWSSPGSSSASRWPTASTRRS